MTHVQAGEMNGMVPPQAVDLEKSVLGALMLDQQALYGAVDKIHEGLFYKSEHQVMFAAIKKLVNCGKEVDMLTVADELRREGKLEQAGGAYYITQLTQNVVSAAHIEYHLQILTEKFMQREVIRTSTESIRDAYDETCDAIKVLDDAQKRLMEVSELSFRRDTTTMDSLMEEVEKKLIDGKQDEDYSLPTGFVDLDRMTSGFQPGQLIILAARPAMGKTACGLTMARNIAMDFKKPVVYFSLEMTGVELVARLLASEAEIPATKLKKATTLSAMEKQRLSDKIYELRQAPLFIDDTSGIDIFEMRAKCRRLHQRHKIKMVFIDYLQLMNASGDAGKNRNREQEISIISRQLKEMAKELEIPVLAMSQLNRKVDERPMQIPMLSDLRESGAIEQDADIVMALHRLWKCGIDVDEQGNSTENQATLRILKHRSGDTGVVDLYFEGRYVRFSNKPIAQQTMMIESKINADIQANTNFDSTDGYRTSDYPDSYPPIDPDDTTPPPFRDNLPTADDIPF